MLWGPDARGCARWTASMPLCVRPDGVWQDILPPRRRGGKNPHKLNGIVPQIVSELFRRFAALEGQGVKFNLWASFVEVVNEKARDLIDEPDRFGNQPFLELRSTPKGDVFISSGSDATGVCTARVESSRALTSLIERALAKRVTDANNVHEHSSRSHALLTLSLERRVGTTSQTSSILIVDLAGSETYNAVRPHQQINVRSHHL